MKNKNVLLTLLQVNAAAEVIYDLVDPTANLIFGAVIDPSLSGQVSYHMVAFGIIYMEYMHVKLLLLQTNI